MNKKITLKVLSKFGEELLSLIKTIGEMSDEFISTPYGQLRIGGSRTSYYRSLKQLQQDELIKKIRKKGTKNYHNVYVLTKRGHDILNQRKVAKKRHDGLSTLIIFDIPEEMSKQRTIFRRYLVRNGYIQLQKSVLISPCTVSDEIKELIKELKLSGFVTVVSGRIDYTL